ncbi:MAG: insulinase family protein [Bacteroidales bacterium]|nr:insulinase family protein [Bacteroidales bacterium]
MEYYTHVLQNGIRLIHQPVNSPVAHCGIFINTGSRDELENQHGMAHLIEHLIFKGTKKRKAYHILSRMEDVGGEMNAYTTKEETCIYTTFFNNYYSRAFDLLSDVLFYSVFPQKEIVKEKEVIIDEINSYKDSPTDQIYDDFEELVFNTNPIARNILGTKKALNSYTRNDIIDFVMSNYATNEIVVSSVSSVSFPRILKYFMKHFSNVDQVERKKIRNEYNFRSYQPLHRKNKKNTYQTHCIIGNQTYSNKDERRYAMHLLNNLLGGPGMNSRLNMTLREKKGLAYNIESNYSTYSDVGIFQVYFGTDTKHLNQCIDLIHSDFKKLKEQKLGTVQLSKAKRQLIGQIAIAAEHNENQMLANGRSMILFDKVYPFHEVAQKIENITSNEIREIANEVLIPHQLSSLVFY